MKTVKDLTNIIGGKADNQDQSNKPKDSSPPSDSSPPKQPTPKKP